VRADAVDVRATVPPGEHVARLSALRGPADVLQVVADAGELGANTRFSCCVALSWSSVNVFGPPMPSEPSSRSST
jgi:hypothetical protein